MKTKLLYLALLFGIITACNLGNKTDNIITISIGDNPTLDTIFISNLEDRNDFVYIARNEYGYFLDTFQLKSGFYNLFFETEYTNVYIEEGKDLTITIDDFGLFDESIKASGDNEKVNNYLFEYMLNSEKKLHFGTLLKLDHEECKAHLEAFKASETSKISQLNFEPHIKDVLTKKLEDDLMRMEMLHKKEYEFAQIKDSIKIAPPFSAKDTLGNEHFLSDFLGSLVYIDVWASWCKPCIAEAPFFKQLKQDFANENIQFLSISLDCPDKIDNWKNALQTHQLEGLQLIADDCFNSSLAKDYYISSIPRFILIGKSGEVISFDAPRPSSDEIRELIQLHLD